MARISAQDRLSIFESVMARTKGDPAKTLQEYTKALSGLKGFQSYMEMTPPPAPVTQDANLAPQTGQNTTLNSGMPPQPMQSTTPGV